MSVQRGGGSGVLGIVEWWGVVVKCKMIGVRWWGSCIKGRGVFY